MKSLRIITLLFFIVLLNTNISHSQDVRGYSIAEIHTKSGEKIECFVKMPLYVGLTKTLTFKRDKDSDSERIESIETDLLVFKSSLGNVNLKYNRYYLKGKKKLSKFYAWQEIRTVCPEITTLVIANHYDKDNYGNIRSYYQNAEGDYLLQRPDEDYPTIVFSVFISKVLGAKRVNRLRKESLEFYFDNDPQMMEWLSERKGVDQFELTAKLISKCSEVNQDNMDTSVGKGKQ